MSMPVLAGAVGCYLAGLACIGIVYHYYAPHASCGLNIFLITWTLIWGMIYTALSVSSFCTLAISRIWHPASFMLQS